MTTPRPGDGGYIYIGGNSLTDYNLTDPRDGSLIDNANISFMTSIQIEGGGIIDNVNASGTPGAPVIGGWLGQKSGYGPEGFFGGGFPGAPVNQLNSAMAMTISNSTLANFQDAAVFTHPDSANALYRDWTGLTSNATPPPILRSGLKGQAVDLYMYNDTIYNTMVSPLTNQFAVGVQVNSESVNDTSGESPMMATIINSTFNQTSHAIRTTSPTFNGQNPNSHVNLLAMNDIFANSTNFAVALVGQAGTNASIGTNGFSQIQYSLFFNNVNNNNNDLPTANPADVIWNTNVGDFEGNVAPIFGDPKFIDPAHGNFGLQATSAAIDAARSEIGPLPAGDMIFPTVNQQLDSTGGIRTDPTTLPFGGDPWPQRPLRRRHQRGDPRKIVTLPGSGSYAFQDEWVPYLSTDPNGLTGPATAPGTYSYVPISGQRDSLGFIRIDDAGVPNTGFGKSPFQDIGAFEYVNLHPPEVTAVTANLVNQPAPVNFYAVGGKSGANQTPQTINVTFSSPIDPNSINASTVQLEELGVSGAVPGPTFISLAGKLSYNRATNTLVINLGGSGLTLPTDAYRLIVQGSGSQVLSSPQGIALDGENLTNNNDPNSGVQLAAPLRRRLSGRQLLRQLHHQHHAPDRHQGNIPARSHQRQQYRGRLRHLHELAELYRVNHRAQSRACASGRPDRDRRCRHRRTRCER